MGWENFLGYMFSSLFTQNKVAKGQLFPTTLQKDKSNPDHTSIYENSELKVVKNIKFFGKTSNNLPND